LHGWAELSHPFTGGIDHGQINFSVNALQKDSARESGAAEVVTVGIAAYDNENTDVAR
jgi:hypothetical protein